MLRILHFADAHIDMANYGRHDPETGLPVRVMDFLRSLDEIVDTAIEERVDMVLFAGDAYKDRSPAPTFQREWGRRIMRLSRAGIRTLLLVGNHDLSPALNRAHALESFDTLEVPAVHVLDRPCFLRPEDLGGAPLQVIALPWVSRSGLLAHTVMQAGGSGEVYSKLEDRLSELVQSWLAEADPDLPTILTAHASVQGAKYGGERTVMLGGDLVLSGSLVRDPRLSYVALGHIHKPQNLNEGLQPPVIYPGSIERVDFGEAKDDKFFVVAHVEKGHATEVEWRQLTHVRPFIDKFVRLEDQDRIDADLQQALPDAKKLEGAIVRLVVEYPRDWEPLIDEARLYQRAQGALQFNLVKRPVAEARVRLPGDGALGSLGPVELLETYWQSVHNPDGEIEDLLKLARTVIDQVRNHDE